MIQEACLFKNVCFVNDFSNLSLQERVESACSHSFFSFDFSLASTLNKASSTEIATLLEELVKADQEADPSLFFQRLSALLPEAELDPKEAEVKAKELLQEAKLFLSFDRKGAGLNKHVESFVEALISLIDSIVAMFGINDLLSPSESELHANFKSGQISMLLGLFSMIAGSVVPAVGIQVGAAVIGSVFLAIAGLSLLWPHIKPMPSHLPINAENWTKEVEKRFAFGGGRKDSLDQIAKTLISGRHAMLIGPSRVGKSVTAKAFAKAVSEGEYPELAGMRVFRINTTDLLGDDGSFLGSQDNALGRLRKAMGRHKEKIILVLDEIHVASKKDEKTAEQLKTLLDEGGDFVHVIGITTSEEYAEHVKPNIPFCLRFDQIPLETMNQDETIAALASHLLREPLQPVVEAGALEEIYNYSEQEEGVQPAKAMKLLKQCLCKAKPTERSPTEEKLVFLTTKKLAMQKNALVTRQKEAVDKKALASIEEEISSLEKMIEQEGKKRASLAKKATFLQAITKKSYELAEELTITRPLFTKYKKQNLKEFALLQRLIPLFEKHIIEEGEALGVHTAIDKRLISSFVPKGV